MKQPSFTIGIEEEYQIIDPVTRELKSYITEMLKADTAILREIKPELHQSVIEVGTSVCRDIKEAAQEVKLLRANLIHLAHKNNLRPC